jgi:hypothetical protein
MDRPNPQVASILKLLEDNREL